MSQHSVALYLRGGTLYVVPQDGGGGVFWDVEPVLSVEPDPEALASVLPEAFAASHVPIEVRDLRRYRSPMRKALGVRSDRELQRDTASLALRKVEAGWVLISWIPARDGRGWETGGVEELPPSTPVDAVAARTLEILTGLPTAP